MNELPRIRSVAGLTDEQATKLAAIARAEAKVAEKVKAAYTEGQYTAFERAESLIRANAEALSTEHSKDIDRIARLWRSNASHMGQARLAIGALLGCVTGMALGWLAHDIGLDHAFQAASDATARGALIGTVQRAAEGAEH